MRPRFGGDGLSTACARPPASKLDNQRKAIKFENIPVDILKFDGFSGQIFDILKPRWILTVALLDPGRRRAALTAWLSDDLPARFAGRILPIDYAIAESWGDLMAESRRTGTALSVMDAFFAATTLAKKLTLVTRNVKDFAPFGVPLLDPWNG